MSHICLLQQPTPKSIKIINGRHKSPVQLYNKVSLNVTREIYCANMLMLAPTSSNQKNMSSDNFRLAKRPNKLQFIKLILLVCFRIAGIHSLIYGAKFLKKWNCFRVLNSLYQHLSCFSSRAHTKNLTNERRRRAGKTLNNELLENSNLFRHPSCFHKRQATSVESHDNFNPAQSWELNELFASRININTANRFEGINRAESICSSNPSSAHYHTFMKL